jgi:hypothetical protein
MKKKLSAGVFIAAILVSSLSFTFNSAKAGDAWGVQLPGTPCYTFIETPGGLRIKVGC